MNKNPDDADTSLQKIKDLLEQTHDQAAREMFAETQKALGRRAIIVDPDTLTLCIEQIKEGNQGNLLTAMGKENDLLVLGLREYIWQWAGRIQTETLKDVGEIYEILENHGAETYSLAKLRGAAQLIKLHLDSTHRESETRLNMNILGLVRSASPQYAKDGKVKGAAIALIFNGGAFSKLEFLFNAQAASNALQRLLENKTPCTQEHCPSTP